MCISNIRTYKKRFPGRFGFSKIAWNIQFVSYFMPIIVGGTISKKRSILRCMIVQ